MIFLTFFRTAVVLLNQLYYLLLCFVSCLLVWNPRLYTFLPIDSDPRLKQCPKLVKVYLRGYQGDFLEKVGFVFIIYSGRARHSANFEPNLSKIGQVELAWHYLAFRDSYLNA